jgi:hypothetical protein
MMTDASPRAGTMQALTALGAIAVVRLDGADAAVRAAEAVHEGGVHAIEVTLTTPGALVDPRRVAAGDFAALTERARRVVASIAEARGGAA